MITANFSDKIPDPVPSDTSYLMESSTATANDDQPKPVHRVARSGDRTSSSSPIQQNPPHFSEAYNWFDNQAVVHLRQKKDLRTAADPKRNIFIKRDGVQTQFTRKSRPPNQNDQSNGDLYAIPSRAPSDKPRSIERGNPESLDRALPVEKMDSLRTSKRSMKYYGIRIKGQAGLVNG